MAALDVTRGYLQMDDDPRRIFFGAYLLRHRRTLNETGEGAEMWNVLAVET